MERMGNVRDVIRGMLLVRAHVSWEMQRIPTARPSPLTLSVLSALEGSS